jgi:flavin reductase (DIM6/NTAB) family NADH-FMN oxidoreductase RutF
MKKYAKKGFPVSDIRRFLEPGPIVLISSAWKGKTNIMTLGWHTVMEFSPLLGWVCYCGHQLQFRNDSQEPRVCDQCAVR